MRLFGLFLLWATITFALAWLVATPYQRLLAGIAGRLAAPPGTTIEWVDLELFFPFDLSVYIALCLASTAASWKARGRALAIGLPVLVLAEMVALLVAMKVMLGSMTATAASQAQADSVSRLATGIIRVTGLVTAAAVWLLLLGRQQLPIVARSLSPPSPRRGGRKP